MSNGNGPSGETLREYIGTAADVFYELQRYVDTDYGFEALWDYSAKRDRYEYKYRRGGKTLVTFYIERGALNVLLVYGKAERERFENARGEFSPSIVWLYENTRQYHDGKWLLIPLKDKSRNEEIKKLIRIKRKPKNKNDQIR